MSGEFGKRLSQCIIKVVWLQMDDLRQFLLGHSVCKAKKQEMKKPVTIGTIIYQFVLTCQIDSMEAFRCVSWVTRYFSLLVVHMKFEQIFNHILIASKSFKHDILCRFKESIRAYGSRAELHIIMKFEYQISFVNVPLAFKLQCTVCIKLMLAFHFPS